MMPLGFSSPSRLLAPGKSVRSPLPFSKVRSGEVRTPEVRTPEVRAAEIHPRKVCAGPTVGRDEHPRIIGDDEPAPADLPAAICVRHIIGGGHLLRLPERLDPRLRLVVGLVVRYLALQPARIPLVAGVGHRPVRPTSGAYRRRYDGRPAETPYAGILRASPEPFGIPPIMVVLVHAAFAGGLRHRSGLDLAADLAADLLHIVVDLADVVGDHHAFRVVALGSPLPGFLHRRLQALGPDVLTRPASLPDAVSVLFGVRRSPFVCPLFVSHGLFPPFISHRK